MKILLSLFLALTSIFAFSGCSERVQPNELGVKVENHGKDPEKDYSLVSGKVYTYSYGTSLYKMPAYEQRNEFKHPIINKTSDSIEFSVKPRYSYRINPEAATRVVKEHSSVLVSNDFKAIQERSLDPAVTQALRYLIEKRTSTELMAHGGNLAFNKEAEASVAAVLKERGFILLSFSSVLDYSAAVKESLEARNSATSEIATLDSKIMKAKKEVELASISAEKKLKENDAITEMELRKLLIQKWDGKLPETYIGDEKSNPLNLMLGQK